MPSRDTRRRIGLLLPSSNTTQEAEFNRMLPPEVMLHVVRLPLRTVGPSSSARVAGDVESESRELADADVDAIVLAATASSSRNGIECGEELIWRIEPAICMPVVPTNQVSLWAVPSGAGYLAPVRGWGACCAIICHEDRCSRRLSGHGEPAGLFRDAGRPRRGPLPRTGGRGCGGDSRTPAARWASSARGRSGRSSRRRVRPETRGIVGREDLARMKPTALLINTSRTELIQPNALLAALRAGPPGFATLDAYEEEPVTGGNHPFVAMPNVLRTPQLWWAEWDNFGLYFREWLEQILAYAQGKPLRLVTARWVLTWRS
jgi:hypothetical protein